MQLAGITGNRLGALLGVHYKDIKITLLPNPKGGEFPRRLIEIAFNTKGYLGEKETNEFGIPDAPDEPCLLLCPHLNLLTLIFIDQAFAPELTSPKQLFRLKIPPGLKQLPVPLKEDMGRILLFRRSRNTIHGAKTSDDEALPNGALRSWIVKLGSVTGMELPTGPYTFPT